MYKMLILGIYQKLRAVRTSIKQWFFIIENFFKIAINWIDFLTFRYRPPHFPQNDIALVRVRGDPIKFSKEIMPICLPPGPRFPDLKGVVYVAGKFKWKFTNMFKKSPNL